jgi:hypothetical protein
LSSRPSLRQVLRLIAVLGALALAVTSLASALGPQEQATSTSLSFATAAAPIPAAQGGGFYIADAGNNLVHKVDAAGQITTVAGTGQSPQNATEADATGPATSTKLGFPTDAVPTSDGGILITEGAAGSFSRIRKVDLAGNISTVAGHSSPIPPSCVAVHDSVGNGCLATEALLGSPTAAVPIAGGGFLIAEWGGGTVRKVDGTTGIISQVAGGANNVGSTCDPSGTTSQIGDGCQATQAILQGPSAAIPFQIDGAAVSTPGTGFLVTEEQGCRVRFVNGSGVISTVAGLTGSSNTCRTSSDPEPPDSGLAANLKLSGPWDARPTATPGQFLLADGFACAVRLVDMSNPTAPTYTTPTKDAECQAGGGFGITAAIPAPGNSYLVADATESQVKQPQPDGSLQVVAGNNGNTAPPSISGNPAVGDTLTCQNGMWSNNPNRFTYVWNRDGTPISGATSQDYVVTTDDQGHALTCKVTAIHDGQTPTTASDTSAPVNVPAAPGPTGGTGPSGPDPTPSPTPTPSPKPTPTPTPSPKPACSFTKASGVIPLTTAKKKKNSRTTPQPKNTLAIAVRCSLAVRATIRGTIKLTVKKGKKTTKKSVPISPRTLNLRAGVSTPTTLRVPSSVITALKAKAKASAALSLSAVTAAGGSGTATKSIPKLSTKK